MVYMKRLTVLAVTLLTAVALFSGDATAARPRPDFARLTGKYTGIGSIVVTERNRSRSISGPIEMSIRLSRSKRSLQITTRGDMTGNNKRGKLLENSTFSSGGGARIKLSESVNGNRLSGNGTASLSPRRVKYTVSAFGFGTRGVVNGTIKLAGTTLRVQTKFRGNDGTEVDIRYLLKKRKKR
jgi:hypothetical protein